MRLNIFGYSHRNCVLYITYHLWAYDRRWTQDVGLQLAIIFYYQLLRKTHNLPHSKVAGIEMSQFVPLTVQSVFTLQWLYILEKYLNYIMKAVHNSSKLHSSYKTQYICTAALDYKGYINIISITLFLKLDSSCSYLGLFETWGTVKSQS